MLRSRSLSEEELAEKAGISPSRVRQLAEIGILRPDERGEYASADIQRVQIAAAYEAGGIALEELRRALEDERMTFEFSDRIYPEASPPSGMTVQQLADDLDVPGDRIREIFMLFGLPRPDPDRALTEAEREILPAFIAAWTAPGMSPDALSRAARVTGVATRSVATGWVDLFMEAIELTPEQRATMTLDALIPQLFEPASRVAGVVEPLVVWLLRRHQEQALNAINVASMEEALGASGLRAPRGADVPAMVFADISGYTQMTEERGDQTAVRSASTLADLAITTAVDHDGRLIKQLGDGVMIAFPRIVPAAQAALELRSAAAGASMPPLHVGIAAGPMVERDGDFFGRTVNLASRLSAAAGPDEILLSEDLQLDSGHATVPLRGIELKGIEATTVAHRLEPSRRAGT